MSEFRSFPTATRLPSEAMEPLVDPAAWVPEDLQDVDQWSYHISERDTAELVAAVKAVRRARISLVDITRAGFPLDAFGDVLKDVRQELMEGRGMVMLRGFPLDAFDREGAAIGYIGLGAHIGKMISQNSEGHLLGHVKDLGGDYSDPMTRGYISRAEMKFHADSCDYVSLLCRSAAKSGGASRVASSVTIYNRMLKERPDLCKVLTEDFYWTRHGEVNPGEDPWRKNPVFIFDRGYFLGRGVSTFITKAQGLPGVPPFTPAQTEAMAYWRQLVEECAFDLDFRVGDIQLLCNHVTVHSRRGFEDWPEPDRKRHLMRLWLSDPDGRPIPKYMRDGQYKTGVLIKGVDLVAPLDAETV
jgi:hypothetical protein